MPRLTSDGVEWVPTADRTLDTAIHSRRGQKGDGVATWTHYDGGPNHGTRVTGRVDLNDPPKGRLNILALGGYYQARDVLDDEVVNGWHAYPGDVVMDWHDEAA
jgi:hypothetical protein